MIDDGYSKVEDANNDGGICCQNCSPNTRKIGYYFTFLVGTIVFVIGIVDLIGMNIYFLVGGSLLLFLCPLWVKKPIAILKELKNPLKIASLILFLVSLVATISLYIKYNKSIINLICGVCLALSGIMYFLSFIENGQKICKSFFKSCCGKDEKKSESEQEVISE